MNKELVTDIVQWDSENWGKCIPLWDKCINTVLPLHCLEIGAQKGGLSLWAALNNHRVVCSDLENPERIAKPLHQKYNVTENIAYQAINILDIPYQDHFDIVFIKSILPSVGKNNQKILQKESIKSICKSLKPGGKLLFAENLTATRLHSFARKKFVNWGESARYLKLEEMLDFLKDFKKVEYQTRGLLAAFGRTEKQRRILGRIDAMTNEIIPARWNYLIIGTATK